MFSVRKVNFCIRAYNGKFVKDYLRTNEKVAGVVLSSSIFEALLFDNSEEALSVCRQCEELGTGCHVIKVQVTYTVEGDIAVLNNNIEARRV